MNEPTKRKVVHHGKGKWEIDYGLIDGVRKRNQVDTEADADAAINAWNVEVKTSGEFWAALPPRQRQVIVTTLTQIREAGQTIDTV